jgi:hypothetical protein
MAANQKNFAKVIIFISYKKLFYKLFFRKYFPSLAKRLFIIYIRMEIELQRMKKYSNV